MIDLSTIKSQKLRELMVKSMKFDALLEEEQTKRVEEMARLSAKQQEKLFCPFFERENKKEAEKMKEIDENQQKAIMELMIQIDEMDKRITRLEKEDIEMVDRDQDGEKQEKLLKELEKF